MAIKSMASKSRAGESDSDATRETSSNLSFEWKTADESKVGRVKNNKI